MIVIQQHGVYWLATVQKWLVLFKMERKVSVRRRRFQKPWAEKCKDYFRNFLAFMFSNVGIIGLVVGYTVAGAFIFIYIEGNAEKIIKQNVTEARIHTAKEIWRIANLTNILDEQTWRANITTELLNYEKTFTIFVKRGYSGFDNVNITTTWTFPGAFLYSLTVITTIGYGNIVPRTDEGKIVTIVYAIIGMPLFLLYLSNIGDIMARSFKWLYAKLCLCRCCPGVAKKREERDRRRAAELSVAYLSNRNGSESPEASIKYGNSEENQPRVTYTSEDENEGDSETATEASYDSQTVSVPVTVCLIIMVGYILGGALLFQKYEDTWSLLDGSYFCFISLSTIGFGDLVPGKTINNHLSSIFGSMYLMLGMALIAMCFNLMQEEVIHKITRTMKTIKYIFRCNR